MGGLVGNPQHRAARTSQHQQVLSRGHPSQGAFAIDQRVCGRGMTRARLFGPRPAKARGTHFRLWAPAAKSVALVAHRTAPMQAMGEGWHELIVTDALPGMRYKFRIDNEIDVPDP